MTKQKNAIDFIGWLKSRKVELIALMVSALLVVIDQITKLLVESNFQYVGEWADHLPNGQGTETFVDGRKYEGGFLNGRHHGQGVMTFPDGDVAGVKLYFEF